MKAYLYTFLLGVVVALAAWLFWPALRQTPNERTIDLSRTAVIRQIQSLNRLETASYSIDKVIEAGTDYDQLRQLLFGDKLLLIAHGKVVAGFDLSTITDKDIVESGNMVTITLPAPKILTTTLDNGQTKVFDRSRGLLTKGDLNLEAEARRQAETAISTAACDGKILEAANEAGQKQLELLFKTAGYPNVTVKTSAPGTCP